MLWGLTKKILFSLDAEQAHDLSVAALNFAKNVSGTRLLRHFTSSSTLGEVDSCEAFGMKFKSAVGLAAGFDKNAELLEVLPNLGFGFADIGR